MTSPTRSVEVQLVLIDPTLRKVAVDRDSRELPRIEIPQNARLARAVQAALVTAWDVHAFVLRRLSNGYADVRVIAAELLQAIIPAVWELIAPGEIEERVLPEAVRRELDAFVSLTGGSGVGAVGWIREASAWLESTVQEQLDPDCLVEQFNGGEAYVLSRFVTITGTAYWLKATNHLNGHELAMTVLLSRSGGTFTPEVLAVHTAWNAWLMREDGIPVNRLSNARDDVAQTLGSAVRALAQVQLRTLGANDLLFAAGAFDQRLERFHNEASRLFAFFASANRSAHGVEPVATANTLSAIEAAFVCSCEDALELAIPSALLHGDLNLGNLAFTATGCRILDWSESYVGFPLINLQHLLLLNPLRDAKVRNSINQELIESYLRILTEGVCERALAEAWQVTPMLAAVSSLYGRGDWLGLDPAGEQRRFAYARIILQHLDAATTAMRSRSKGGSSC